ncbi:hypothetical protein ABPG72_022767 [Tetrahymena utriculariae]
MSQSQIKEPEQNQPKEFEQEGRETIKAVFVKFDKDNSGQLDYSELKQVAQELGVQLETNEIQNIFSELDVNKDQKISFEEFWEWWKLGRPNKLEKMIYYKLKSMKLLKKAHANFLRLGSALDVKYDKSVDKVYVALNYGSHPGDTRIQAKVHLNTQEGDDLIRESLDGFQRNENEQDHQEIVAIVIRIKSNKPEEAAKDIQFLIDSLKSMLLQLANSMNSTELVNMINLFKIYVQHYQNSVIIKFSFPPDIYKGFTGDDPTVNQITNIYTQSFYQTNLNFTLTAGVKNSLKKISSNFNQKFVDWLFEGFLFEVILSCNHSFTEQLSMGFIQVFQQSLDLLKLSAEQNDLVKVTYDQLNKVVQQLSLLYLLRSAKFHLVFKDIENVESFFNGIGMGDSLKNQPSCKELLDEIKEEYNNFKDFKDQNSYWNIIYKFFQCFAKNCEGQASVSIIYKKMIAQLVFSIEGIAEIFEYLMK